MSPISEKAVRRTDGALIWLSRIIGFTRVFGLALLLALLFNPVQALSATPSASYSVTLEWDSNPGSDEITGYRVYYGAASRNYSDSVVAGNVTSSSVPGLEIGVTYFFAVTAYDAGGLESDFSDEVSYTRQLTGAQVQTYRVSGGQFALSVRGLAGHTYDIEATQDFSTWTVIGTVTLDDSGLLDFTDTHAADFPRRFYRTRDTQP